MAALGQFKRGKSTLLNALLGMPLLPMGVTPVTAIPTFIRAGDSTRIRITFDGDKEPIIVSDGEEIPEILENYISEARNPHNRLRVAGVAIEAPSEFLRQGVTLIDTPGVGSTFLHNTSAAEASLAECDAAVFGAVSRSANHSDRSRLSRKSAEIDSEDFFRLEQGRSAGRGGESGRGAVS